MYGKKWITIGCVLAAIGVTLGALGAHGVEQEVQSQVEAGTYDSSHGDLLVDSWRSAVRYHMFHAIGIILVGFGATQWCSRWLTIAGSLFLTGVILFSGLLYIYVGLQVAGGERISALGAIVPIGGLAMIAGWLAFAHSLRGAGCKIEDQ